MRIKALAAVLAGTMMFGHIYANASIYEQHDAQFSPQAQPTPPAETLEALNRFSGSLEVVKQLYVDELTDKKILDKAIAGLLSKLDPHSEYLDEKAYESLNIATDGNFTGVGIEVTMEHGVLKVVSPIDDTPAHKAGMEPGDLIIRVDGKPIKGLNISEIVGKIRGKIGTDVRFTVIRKGNAKPLQVRITRDKIHLVSVKEKILDDHFGYIRLSSFQMNTTQELHKAIDSIKEKANGQLRGIVLDMRNNPGGVLPISVEVADAFLDANNIGHDQKVVSTKGRVAEMQFEGKAVTRDRTEGVPIVALINIGSASASEIVAAALQDHGRAVIMGQRSFGKGSVQTVMPLADQKTAIKLTTARFYTPAGRAIQHDGVTPDIKIEKLHVTKSKASSLDSLSLREANLNHSLTISQKSKADEEQDDQALIAKIKEDKGEQPLAQKDYELNQALNLLKGLYALQKHAIPKAVLQQAKKG